MNTVKILIVSIISFILLGCSADVGKKMLKGEISKLEFATGGHVDILFIIDDSGSMSAHQINLSTQFDQFLSGLAGFSHLNYQMAVITNTKSKFHGGIFNSNSSLFSMKQAFLVGTSGNPTEVFFETVWQSITNPSQKQFFRKDAYLVVIFVTDADDQGRISASQFHQYLVSLKKDKDKILTYGALAGKRSCTQENWPARKLKDFIRLTHAHRKNIKQQDMIFDLCGHDMGTKLFTIGKHIGDSVGKRIFLKHIPDLNTITVKFGGVSVPQDPVKGWSYNPQYVSIDFGEELDLKPTNPKDKLEIFYLPAQ